VKIALPVFEKNFFSRKFDENLTFLELGDFHFAKNSESMRLKLSTCGPNLVPISESFGTFLAKKNPFPLAAQRSCGFRGQQRKGMSGFLTKLE